METKTNLSETEAAKTLGISRTSLYRLRREGRLSFYRYGRKVLYGTQHLARYLAEIEQGPRYSAPEKAGLK